MAIEVQMTPAARRICYLAAQRERAAEAAYKWKEGQLRLRMQTDPKIRQAIEMQLRLRKTYIRRYDGAPEPAAAVRRGAVVNVTQGLPERMP
jgi:hypothetical protein